MDLTFKNMQNLFSYISRPEYCLNKYYSAIFTKIIERLDPPVVKLVYMTKAADYFELARSLLNFVQWLPVILSCRLLD